VPPATNTIIDNAGNSWSVVGGVVYENGSPFGVSYNVILLLWYNGVIFQQNNNCGVWYASNGKWLPTQFPGGITAPATVGYTCPGIGGIWTAVIAGSSLGTNVLFTTPATINSSWSGPINFFYEAYTAGCVGVANYSGTLSYDNSVAGESPLFASGAGNILNNGSLLSSDCVSPGYSPNSYTGSLVPGASLSMTQTDSAGNHATIN
jgi:hypothetical protein